jgi:predicted unusual protein kinase regulating ubiquinone biosynthesis (AarF/ABC1/UbiB family)
VAAASLAQVYLATLNDGKDTKVAVKVQRPSVLGVVSKDLYVLRRAAEVFQGLVERFAPQQRTNYVALLNEWSIGFYTELDFNNEARNQQKLRDSLNIKGLTVPKVYHEYCTRRLLVSEWVEGKKLSDAAPEEINRVTPFAQEAFLTQLFETGCTSIEIPFTRLILALIVAFLLISLFHSSTVFHADPHPGNLLLLNEPTEEGDELALIDCGLMAEINNEDRDYMISAVIHLANKDYASLVDDFMKLKILPEDSNRAAIIPLMDKALSPYVKGGGAKKYEEELKKLYGMEDGSVQSTVGGFQAMTQDALTVLNDIPFSIPPYFAILGRAIVTLEGVALTGNPEYGIIMESYPFIARKLLREDRPEIQTALQEVLYSGDDSNSGLKLSRLLALLNNAAGAIATKEGASFVDLDAVPEDGLNFKDGLKFLLSDKAESLRNLLEKEVDSIVDILSRQIFRKAISEAVVALTPPRPPAIPFIGDILPPAPKLDEVPLPLFLPGSAGIRESSLSVLTLNQLTDAVAPKLNQDDELFALGLADAATEFFGEEVGAFVKGESVFSSRTAEIVIAALRSGAIGQTDALSPETVNTVLESVSNTLSLARGSNLLEGTMEKELTEAIVNLDESESARLHEIVTELTERSIARALKRLSKVDRVF